MPARASRDAAPARSRHARRPQKTADPGDRRARPPHEAAVGLTASRYHAATKHHFTRFARSLGYLDWAAQPDPFRRFAPAPRIDLPRVVLAGDVPYGALFDGSAPARPVTDESVGEFLRCSMGLSAWKQFGASRWALRVNPSSGNLHPTETYVIGAAVRSAAARAEVCHYDVRGHGLERRCEMAGDVGGGDTFLVALTSIHWREAWKYGERAFRYCQHDAGHAIGALRVAAALLGWRLILLSQWSHADLAALLGLDRDSDFGDAEREEPECIAAVGPGDVDAWRQVAPAPLVAAARAGTWAGRANRLSAGHVPWPIIDEVAEATRVGPITAHVGPTSNRVGPIPTAAGPIANAVGSTSHAVGQTVPARQVILQRRSAVAFDGRSELSRAAFLGMLRRLQPGAPPWDAIDWTPQMHLALFVHRVTDLTPGVYVYVRDRAAIDELRAAMRPEFLWEPLAPSHPAPSHPAPSHLFLLLPLDVRRVANRVSCDQDIAADGFFSLGMIARFGAALAERGEPFYRRLFWEAGLIGQVLYLEAEAAGARSTGIGCYYDDPVHELLGLSGDAWQSLYHFSMGMPVDDTRLTTEPGYDWDR